MTTLAHEMGHYLGYRKGHKFGHPDSEKKHWLMSTIDWKTGAKVPRQYVLYFNLQWSCGKEKEPSRRFPPIVFF